MEESPSLIISVYDALASEELGLSGACHWHRMRNQVLHLPSLAGDARSGVCCAGPMHLWPYSDKTTLCC